MTSTTATAATITTTATPTPTITTLTVGRATLRYRVFGTGPALVLVHGTGPGSVTWDGLHEQLAGHHTVILPDLSGSDPVVDDGAPFTVETLAAQLAAVIEHAAGEHGVTAPVDVVGHSLGAAVVLALAATRPDLVRRLIPVAGWSGERDEYMRNTMDLFRSLADRPEAFARFAMLTAFSKRHLNSIGRPAVDELARRFVPTPGRTRQLDAVRHALRHAELSRLVPAITAPTLVIGCVDDGLVPVGNSRDLHAAIPGSRYAELDSGHVARVERPEELVALVHGFLD